jgi:hypothetical protein
MKVLFDLRAGRIAIEGDGPDLLKVLELTREIAPRITQIQILADSSDVESERHTEERRVPETRPHAPQTMRQFARSLALNNVAERIAALAYYTQVFEGRPSFSPKEMDGWFTMCGFQKPGQMTVALYDTKRKYGYSDNVSRGNWRVSNNGENLIIRKIEERDQPTG